VADWELHVEKGLQKVQYENALEEFKVNSLAPLFFAKNFLDLFPKGPCPPTTLFRQDFSIFASISARVGSIAENVSGGWYSYRASKAAQNQITKTLSVEARLAGIQTVVLGYHPGTVLTGLAGDMGRRKAEHGEEGTFPADEAVDKMVNVLGQVQMEQSGQVLDWKGEVVPW